MARVFRVPLGRDQLAAVPVRTMEVPPDRSGPESNRFRNTLSVAGSSGASKPSPRRSQEREQALGGSGFPLGFRVRLHRGRQSWPAWDQRSIPPACWSDWRPNASVPWRDRSGRGGVCDTRAARSRAVLALVGTTVSAGSGVHGASAIPGLTEDPPPRVPRTQSILDSGTATPSTGVLVGDFAIDGWPTKTTGSGADLPDATDLGLRLP
jgi:hypothetical protein